MGKGYVIEHCISFFHRENEKRLYAIYLTDALKMIVLNTSKQGCGTITERYADLLHKMDTKTPEKQETEEEIISRLKKKLGGEN